MKNILRIYKRDIKTICTNWAAAIMIFIIIMIPSLYSLINIYASWDPYSNTGGIKIAVVNNDEGVTYKEQDINIGDELIDKLKDNDKMGWEIVDEDTAKNGLLEEKYYAMIEVPQDFSEKVTTLMSKDVEKPKLIYTVNEKKNSIAPKITDAGVKSVKNQLDDNIVKTVSGIMFRICDETGIDIEGKRPDIRKVIDEVYELDEEMPKLEEILDNTIDGTGQIKDLIDKTNDIIPTVSDTLDSANDFISNSNDFVMQARSDFSDISPVVKNNLVLSESLLDNTSVNLKNLNDNIIPETAKKTLISASETAKATQTTAQETKGKLQSIKKFIKKIIDYDMPEMNFDSSKLDSQQFLDDESKAKAEKELKNLKNQYEEQVESFNSIKKSLKKINSVIDNMIEKLDDCDEKLDIAINHMQDEINDIDNGNGIDTSTIESTISVVDDAHTLVSDLIDSYDSEIDSTIESAFDNIQDILNISLSAIKEGTDILPDLQDILSSTMDISDYTSNELQTLKEKIPDAKDKIHELAGKLREMDDEGKYDEILDMITNNWDDQSDFLASPVQIEDNRLFPYPNYGSASSPFYTVLCLWVGALIGSALLSLEVHDFEDGTVIRPYEKYLGKLLTFLTLAVFEALVPALGALFLLKVYAVHPVMFVFYCIFVSIVFAVIVYTAGSLLDDVGKSLIVVILVLQLAGTNGTFPIEVNPEIFQKIYMYLPFTYATNGMRQIMAGIVYKILIRDICILCVYMFTSLIIGITLKGVLNKGTAFIINKLYSSGILRH